MADALIGYTGFVGGNLGRQRRFDAGFNSRNIDTIRGQRFELLVCAGAPAEKWRANKEPAADLAAIERLADAITSVVAEEVVLISTVDVYPTPVEVDERTPPDSAQAQPYGKHRALLEERLRARWPGALVLRLPGLFGAGLKKNVIYDLLHRNRVEAIHSDAVFQFYSLEHLWADIERCRSLGIRLLNVATEPVQVAELAAAAFGLAFENRPAGTQPARYDFRSIHAGAWGGSRGYLYERAQVLEELRRFVVAERAR